MMLLLPKKSYVHNSTKNGKFKENNNNKNDFICCQSKIERKDVSIGGQLK